MRLFVVAVYDRALGAFARPAFVPSIGVAKRSFGDEVNNPESEMFKHPEHYELHHLGIFDDEAGVFSEKPTDTLLDMASQLMRGRQ